VPPPIGILQPVPFRIPIGGGTVPSYGQDNSRQQGLVNINHKSLYHNQHPPNHIEGMPINELTNLVPPSSQTHNRPVFPNNSGTTDSSNVERTNDHWGSKTLGTSPQQFEIQNNPSKNLD
jgi:hypothetical protein